MFMCVFICLFQYIEFSHVHTREYFIYEAFLIRGYCIRLPIHIII